MKKCLVNYTAVAGHVQEQLKQDVASLQKQLASQKADSAEQAKAQEQLQQEHERELRHLKREIKHKLVGYQRQTHLEPKEDI